MNVNNKMDIFNDEIKYNYYEIKRLLETFISFLLIFENDFYLTQKDVSKFLNIHNIFDLSNIFYQYYILNQSNILEYSNYIIENVVITDDIDNKDLFTYAKAYILIKINNEPHKHEDLFDLLIYLSQYYTQYLEGMLNNIISSIELEEGLYNLSI